MIVMKCCRKTWISKVVGWLSVLALMPLGVALLIASVCFLIDSNVWASIFSLSIGIFLLWFGNKESSFELRKYSITSEGLYLGNKQKAFYSWDQIYEIGVFYFDAASSLQVYDKVICCSLSPPPVNFKQILFHNSCIYAQRNQSKFIVIDYDEETIYALSKAYQKNIFDYTTGMTGYIRNGKNKT